MCKLYHKFAISGANISRRKKQARVRRNPRLPHRSMPLPLGEDGVLRRLAEAELRLRAGRNLDRLAGRGIAARASLALRLQHLAEAREHDALGLLGACIGDSEERLIGGDSLLLGDAGGLRDGGRDVDDGGKAERMGP